jgi:hypothetical protein
MQIRTSINFLERLLADGDINRGCVSVSNVRFGHERPFCEYEKMSALRPKW